MGNLTELTLPQLFELDELEVIHTLEYSKNEQVGFLIASENANGINFFLPTIRLYLIKSINGNFEVTKELEAFTFQTREEALQFANQLSTMSAFELILSVNNIKI